MIPFTIDELMPCLKCVETGDVVETEVVRLRRKSFLDKFNSRTGWYVSWSRFPSCVEVYALVIKGTMDIQGLIAIENDTDACAVHIHWACVSPDNNVWEYGKKKYIGVGGHLFAIAGNKSKEYGYDGFVYAEAMDEANMSRITEEYNYEDFGEEI